MACGREQAPPSEQPIGPTVEVRVDDGAPRRVAVTTPVTLVSLVGVAPDAWLEVTAAAGDERTLELTRPAATYPDTEVRIYIDQARPAIGVFRSVTPTMPPDIVAIAKQPVVSLVDVSAIHVHTRPRELPPLTVVADGRAVSVSTQLRDLAKLRATTPRERGWRLGDVIGLVVPADRVLRSVRLHAQGAITEIDVQALRAPTAIFKENQRGEYVFRMWDNAKSRQLEVRGVTKIEVE